MLGKILAITRTDVASVSLLQPHEDCSLKCLMKFRARILVQVTIYRRLLLGRDSHLNQSEAHDIS